MARLRSGSGEVDDDDGEHYRQNVFDQG
ncbi:MAG: hypothetical protein JWQ22_2672, partial [Devosia sp.]|nr:hypothetical protein [Devosia sp.]